MYTYTDEEQLDRSLGMDKVTVIIPTLNEASAIGKVLSEMPNELLDEVIVVDSSSDDTSRIAQGFGAKVILETRKGYGRALQTGIENARGEIVVYIDGDYTYDASEIVDVVKPILDGKCDAVLGSRLRGRMLPNSMSKLNKLGNLILSLVFDVLFFKRVSDTQSGFRAIKKSFLEGLSCRDYGMPYVIEQLIKLVKIGARVGEVPIKYRPRIGKTKLCAWTDGFKILKVILRERLIGEKL